MYQLTGANAIDGLSDIAFPKITTMSLIRRSVRRGFAVLGSIGSGAAPTQLYQNTGTFTAVLMVTDHRGATDTAQVSITANTNPNVINAPSEIGFYIELHSGGTSRR